VLVPLFGWDANPQRPGGFAILADDRSHLPGALGAY